MKVSDYADIGQYLQECRESLGITLEQAAAALHIRQKYLKAIETGAPDDLPGWAYLRGYIKNYAAYLGLDAREVLQAYAALLSPKRQRFFVPEPASQRHMPSQRVLYLTLAGLALLYGVWYIGAHHAPLPTEDMGSDVSELLDKSIPLAMDKAWGTCLITEDWGCFFRLRAQSIIPDRIAYDLLHLPSDTPQEP